MNEVIIGKKDGRIAAAFISDGKLCEYYDEDKAETRNGNIYRAKITNTVQSLNAAFAEIPGKSSVYIESAYSNVSQGNSVLLQIKRLAFENKYHLATRKISLSGKYIIAIANDKNMSVSKKITGREERERLKGIAGKYAENGIGIIMRTTSEGISEDKLRNEIIFLVNLLHDVLKRGSQDGGSELIYEAPDLLECIIRDRIDESAGKITVEGPELFKSAREYIIKYSPDFEKNLKQFTGHFSIFDAYNISAELRRIFSRKIWLDSGAYIIIDKTEAMTVIDVNSGKNTGRHDFETMARKINEEAAIEIARVLSVRNIGGIVIVDFLKMKGKESGENLLNLLKNEFKRDKGTPVAAGMTNLGLVEITRKRI